MSKVIVVGGGAAGMMAAVAAADMGHTVTLLEKNEKLGKKVYITGKGRCNITNDSEVDNLLANVVSNPKFLYSAFYAFDSQRMMEFLQQEGLEIKTERGNRVFPMSDKSSDVIRVLQNALQKRGVEILFHCRTTGLIQRDGKICGVRVDEKGIAEKELPVDAVIIATGGISYPSTGSTGDGYRFAESVGHRITSLHPALVPLNLKDDYAKAMQGLSLRNVTLSLRQGKRVIYEEQGEMLFTHFGISGPLVLSASSQIGNRDFAELTITVDLKPALSEKQLDDRILRDFQKMKNSYFKNSLSKLLPAKMIPVIIELSKIPAEKQVNEITREERQNLVKLLKEFPLTPDSFRGYNEAIITSGGVAVGEINPATMESKKQRGLYFAGEVLDLDAVTGGYNLQIAWSTGYLAGISVE